jgi:Zn-finger nucleic acid-binding protein
VTCTSCGADLPVAFPGATVTCVCGARITHPPGPGSTKQRAADRLDAGPYRSARTCAPLVEMTTSCPFCANPIGALVRICPHCDVRLDHVRCTRCFSLQAPGTFACMRCGEAMDLEPLLDATDAPCPRCRKPLEVANAVADAQTHECPRCGGIFVSRDALADIMCRAEIGGALPDLPARMSSKITDDVRYLPCPLCHSTMNRANFGRVSGVIVDVCSKHGTWFDAGELTRAVAFAGNGGLERSRAREREEAVKKSTPPIDGLYLPPARSASPLGHDLESARLTLWREFLSSILGF